MIDQQRESVSKNYQKNVVIHENVDTSSRTLCHANMSVPCFLQDHLLDQHPHKPIFLPHIQGLFKKKKEEKLSILAFPLPIHQNMIQYTSEATNLMRQDLKEQECPRNTHVEIIYCWVINHLNKINYIGMAQHFHDQNLQKWGKNNKVIHQGIVHEDRKTNR